MGASGWVNFGSSQRRPRQLTAGPMNYLAPVFSGNSEKLFVIGEQQRGELVHYDTGARQFLPYLSGISADRLGFSRDGQWVATSIVQMALYGEARWTELKNSN